VQVLSPAIRHPQPSPEVAGRLYRPDLLRLDFFILLDVLDVLVLVQGRDGTLCKLDPSEYVLAKHQPGSAERRGNEY
jgi:hypothetical protein